MTTTVYKTVSSQSLPAIPCDNDGNLLMRESDTYEVLRKKRQALEEKLQLKLQQLKSLCLKEADIIGELPPETPLDPNEPAPQIRKRIGAEFILNQNLLLKARCFEEENLVKLELELELQRKIVKANLKLTNEVNLKKNVKKKRFQSYQDAVLKLKELEKKLLDMKKNMEDGSQYENQRARSEINFSSSDSASINIRPKSSLALVSDINQFDDDEESAEHNESYLSTSAPSTPAKFREPERHIRPISPPNTITPGSNRYDIRPSSVHFPFEKGTCEVDSHQPERCKTAEHFSHDYDSCSLGSASSCESSIFRVTNDTKRRNILSLLQTRNSSESLDAVSSHLYSLPKREVTVESVGSTQRMANIGEPKLSNIAQNSSELNLLTRNDSLENTRRKSYVSAIQSPHISGALHHQPQHHYHCLNNSVLTEDCEEFAQPELITKGHRQTQPLCVPAPPSINMASRPLPPPPSPSCSSSSSRASPSIHNTDSCSYNSKLDESKLYQNVCEFSKGSSIPDDHLDISAKAVRSSIIRTPIAITISTSSTDASQLINNRQPSTPAPNLPPRTPSSIPSSASTIHNDDNIFFATKATTFNPDSLEQSHSNMPPPKVWSETDLDSHPSKIERKHDPKYDSSYNIYYNDPPEIDVVSANSHDYENIEPSEQIDSHMRNIKYSSSSTSSCKVSPRPPSIPLSPTIPTATNGVEVNVVSVGHFQPYWEETKPYELSDFFKYSAKHRKKTLTESGNSRSSLISTNSTSTTSIASQQTSSSIPVTTTTPKVSNNKLISSNPKIQGVSSASHVTPYRDQVPLKSNGPISNSKSITKDSSINKKDLYKDDVNWYENDIIKNPTIV
ncbi:FERM domain-containing protein 4A [Tetranychus urticae]|uniref:Cytohesin Ubiquitin Protein Inducing domain-containing protein n=1 Tax=Tetranychus urticae TaxID=32264 RepID=T1K6J5_TETUR|nr:FERM domain-containing protein 4A [Tetranychus urticae]